MPQWRVHLHEHHEGYITMEEFEQNRRRLARNRTNGEGRVLSGPAREGYSMLQGLLLCGTCGRALTVRYRGNGGIYPVYECNWKRREGLTTKNCLTVRTGLLDGPICEEVFKVLKPAEIELAMAALNEIEQRDHAIMQQWRMRIERAEYECALAERRYEEVDPSNRLVAASLERRWDQALVHLDAVKTEAATFQSKKARVVTPEQKAKVLALAHDLPKLWRAATTEPKDQKRMLRLLIRDITVEKLADARQIVMHVRWQGGACRDISVALPGSIADQLRYTPRMIERVRELSRELSDPQIVQALNQQGVRSSRGLPFTLAMIKWIRYRRHRVRLSDAPGRTDRQATRRTPRGEHPFRSLLDQTRPDRGPSTRRTRPLVGHRHRPTGTASARTRAHLSALEGPSFQFMTVRSAL